MSPHPPLEFSVLMPVYRADTAERVRRAAESATVEQRRRPAELVVVRDGPVPAALEAELDRLVRELPVPVVRVDLERNEGLTAALTAGLDRCRHDVVARADADDVSYPRRFAVQLPVIEAGADLVGSSMHEIGDDERTPIALRRAPVGERDILSVSRRRNPVSHPTVVFRRSAVRAAGGYEHVPLAEDYWLWVRMLRAGADVRNVAEPLVGYRVSAGSYERRGGWRVLRAELALQARLRGIGHVGFLQWVRNVVVRGGYRFVPTRLRELAYRAMVGAPRP
ncbi:MULTISPECIES: glycosyltransferase [Kocuria]|uniref:Glycosyltransferase n=1 Tax=Kocuria rosea subsp. polaris TaxID=136273 RepID=A0A0A6YBA6_KOCRO|nr:MULTISPECIES: glycosyltransferase [Kocuria]MCC5784716.1 glycosyltransferase [Kocuria sp. CCUG 69068]EYT51960.1 glycosyltransferase [Kocuria sp. UCD-OTCP]KHD96687.1 glycosyltransferase [Kocuria polaris]MCM3485342.1 glycosyltransferase [Kocuria rosea]MEB2528923.1 glycosyltransferase [Kocuria rosea]